MAARSLMFYEYYTKMEQFFIVSAINLKNWAGFRFRFSIFPIHRDPPKAKPGPIPSEHLNSFLIPRKELPIFS